MVINLEQLNGFLLLINLLCFFKLKKTLHKVICYNLFKAGSGSALKKTAGSEFALRRTAGSGSAKNEFGSTGLERNVGEKEEGHLFHSCHTSYSEPECDVTVINIRGSEQLVPGQLQAALGQVALTKVLQYSSTQVTSQLSKPMQYQKWSQ